MDLYSKEETQQVSKINEAGFQIQRIHNYWLKAEYYAGKGNLSKWKFALDSIWRELAADIARNKEPKTLRKENDDLIKEIIEAGTPALLYQALQKRHMFLKVIQDKSGKGALWHNPEDDEEL